MNTCTDPCRDAMRQSPTFTQALDAWRAGAHDEALTCCTELLVMDPCHADALHLAGVIHLARNRETARRLLNQALAVREDPDILVSLALACDAAGPAQGQALLERALELDPKCPHALNNLAHLRAANGEVVQALALLERLLAVQPDNALAQYNYGSLMLMNGAAARAQTALRRAVELDPSHVNSWANLASALIALNRHTEALVLLDDARTQRLESADLLANLGCLQRIHGRHHEARTTLTRAIELEPQNASAWNSLGNVFCDLGQNDEARLAYARTLELRPGFADAHGNLATALKGAGAIEAAIAGYRRALECEPDNRRIHSNLAYSLTFVTDDAAAIRTEAEACSIRQEAPWRALDVAHLNAPGPERRLRIGYLSPDFRNHCQMLFTTPLFTHHDHEAFEIVCYSTVVQPDDVTRRLALHADVWCDVHELEDGQLAQQIRDDRIDILVDLTMHMDGARRLVFVRRPAPVQVAWLAYPGTTGSVAIDWRLTDPWLDPYEAEAPNFAAPDQETRETREAYTERTLRLPNTFWCYDALAPGVEVNALPALEAGHITFGCLNNPCKLTEATLALWAGVLAAVPDSRLVLMAPEGTARRQLETRLAAYGVEAERVRFVGFQEREAYLRTYGQIDIALDTVPYNGHTTSLDAFWMGVPVPTRVGRAVAGRAGLSFLANLGLEHLVARSDAEYADIVTALARDLPRLSALRAGMRARMQASPLTDAPRFAGAMEAAYRHMWRAWCDEVLPHQKSPLLADLRRDIVAS